MGGAQCLVPGRPLLAREIGRVEPLGQFRLPWRLMSRSPAQKSRRESFGHGIDRLHAHNLIGLIGRDHVIRVGHLPPPVEHFDFPADEPGLADRQHTFQVVVLGMEENEGNAPGGVTAGDAIGRPRPGRRRCMGEHLNGQGADPAGRRISHFGRKAAVHHAGRQMPQQIDQLFPRQTLHKLRQTRADARQRGNCREKWDQGGGPQGRHGNSLGKPTPPGEG